MKLSKILKELRRSCGDDEVQNCIIFWECPEGIRLSFFPIKPDSFPDFIVDTVAALEKPDEFFNRAKEIGRVK